MRACNGKSVRSSWSQRGSLLSVSQREFNSPRLHISGSIFCGRQTVSRSPWLSAHNAGAPGMLSAFGTVQLPDVTGRDTSSFSGGLHLSVTACSVQVTVQTCAYLVLAWINCEMSNEWSILIFLVVMCLELPAETRKLFFI